MRLPLGSGGQGDILSELQDGAGVHDGDRFQGKRAEDEGEGGMRVFMTMIGSNLLQNTSNSMVAGCEAPRDVGLRLSDLIFRIRIRSYWECEIQIDK